MKVATTSQGVMFLVSLVLHAGVGASIATIPRRPPKTKMVVTLNTVKKPKPLPPPEPPPPPPEPETPPPPPPPPPPEPPKARPRPKAQPITDAPPPKPGPAAPAAFDTGMTLGSGGSGSFELPAGSTGEARAAPAPASTASALPAPRKVKAADSCSEPIVKAKPLELVQPSYPESERAAGTRGKVRVEIQLDASGGVRSAKVLQSLSPACDDAAIKAARRFRFSPATRCGKPVPHKFNLSLRFEL